jgi:hypothetical protein
MDALLYDADNLRSHAGNGHGRVVVLAFMRGAKIFLSRLLENVHVATARCVARIHIELRLYIHRH